MFWYICQEKSGNPAPVTFEIFEKISIERNPTRSAYPPCLSDKINSCKQIINKVNCTILSFRLLQD
jgi:hypothetical protein